MTMEVFNSAASQRVGEPVTATTPHLTAKIADSRTRFSTLRGKTLLVILVATVGLLVALVVPLYTIILGSFVQLEEARVRTNINRGISALDEKSSDMLDIGLNWSASDDTYNFVATHDPGYLQTSVPDSS